MVIPSLRRLGAFGAVSLVVLLLAGACGRSVAPPASQPQAEQAPPLVKKSDFKRPDLLMETEDLAAALNSAGLRIVDLRAADKYTQGHIPGAVNLNSGTLDQSVDGVQDLAPPAKVAQILGSLGIGESTRVVLYDDQRTLISGRVFWVLDYLGHKDVAVLNGGFPKWALENREVTRVAPRIEAAVFTPRPDASKVADAAYILAKAGEKSVVFCDARTPSEYEGADARAGRGGHIPGAVNLNWEENVTAADTPLMKDAARLKQLYEQAGVTPDKEVVTYCQTGVRAAQAYFTLRLLGYEKVRNYDGSWQQWGNDPSLPVETGKKG